MYVCGFLIILGTELGIENIHFECSDKVKVKNWSNHFRFFFLMLRNNNCYGTHFLKRQCCALRNCVSIIHMITLQLWSEKMAKVDARQTMTIVMVKLILTYCSSRNLTQCEKSHHKLYYRHNCHCLSRIDFCHHLGP